jgi:hypothetical protein
MHRFQTVHQPDSSHPLFAYAQMTPIEKISRIRKFLTAQEIDNKN